MTSISALRRRMIDDMTIRNLSRSTQESYIYAVAKFSRYFRQASSWSRVTDVAASSARDQLEASPAKATIWDADVLIWLLRNSLKLAMAD